MKAQRSISVDETIGKDVRLCEYVNLHDCEVRDYTKIGAFVEIRRSAKVGKNLRRVCAADLRRRP
jgi:bifunctional N-acetylglucosamine-1-phosphate-uridyltransferase/glucosamine-1-phosphate-acetyltransferase GlmU-like protein